MTREQIKLLNLYSQYKYGVNFSELTNFGKTPNPNNEPNRHWGEKFKSHMRETSAVGMPMMGAVGGALLSQMKYNRDKAKLEREGKSTKHLKRGRYLFNGMVGGGIAGLGLGAISASQEEAYRKRLDEQNFALNDSEKKIIYNSATIFTKDG